jgi:hypothetical protein
MLFEYDLDVIILSMNSNDEVIWIYEFIYIPRYMIFICILCDVSPTTRVNHRLFMMIISLWQLYNDEMLLCVDDNVL